MTNQTVTLSRAHKIAERLVGLISEAQETTNDSLDTKCLAVGVAKDFQSKALREQGVAGIASLKRSVALCDALASVRADIGNANNKFGVSSLLAQQDGLRRKLALYRSAIAKATPTHSTALDIDQFDSLSVQTGDTVPSYLLSPLLAQELKVLRDEQKVLESEFIKIGDQISDANANRIELTIPDDIAVEVM